MSGKIHAEESSSHVKDAREERVVQVDVSSENDGKSASEGGESSEGGEVRSEERLVFSGTDRDTIEMAKSFWQSVTLQPPLESNLVAFNIKQRLPKAPQVQSVSRKPAIFHSSRETNDALLARFFARAHEKTVTDETERVKRLAYHRMQMLQILEKRKKERMQKEFISEDFKPSQQTVMDFSELQEEVALYTEDELAWELEQLNSFERTTLREVQTPSSQQSD